MQSHERQVFLKPTLRGECDQHTCPPDSVATEGLQSSASDTLLPGLPEIDGLGSRETAKLSFEFCVLWFIANYSLAAGLEYTTVASSTILLSTSSIWTMILGALIGVEEFQIRKLVGVLGSLAGITIISAVDLSGDMDKNRGSFPHKSGPEIAIGDFLSIGSAVVYGIYTILMKKRVGNESRVNMLLFFGFVGAINTALLWPGFVVLHFTGIEPFELPPDNRVWTIILVSLRPHCYLLPWNLKTVAA